MSTTTQKQYTPENLKKWTRPDSYMGETFPDFYTWIGQTRDSDLIERCNFDAAVEALKQFENNTIPGTDEPTVQVHSFSHWACGWVEGIFIHESDADALKCADEMQAALEQYPVLDDSRLSEMELQEEEESWDSWVKYDFTRELYELYRRHYARNESEELLHLCEMIDDAERDDFRALFYEVQEREEEEWYHDSTGMSTDVEKVAAAVTPDDLYRHFPHWNLNPTPTVDPTQGVLPLEYLTD